MCRRCAMSAGPSPCRSRSAASALPGLCGCALSAIASTAILFAALGELAQLRRVRIEAAKLLHVALFGHLVLVRARDLHAEHEALERRRREARVARHVDLGVLVRAALERERREVEERADEIGADQRRAAQVLLGLRIAPQAAHAKPG